LDNHIVSILVLFLQELRQAMPGDPEELDFLCYPVTW